MDFQSDSLTDGIPVNTIFISYVEQCRGRDQTSSSQQLSDHLYM